MDVYLRKWARIALFCVAGFALLLFLGYCLHSSWLSVAGWLLALCALCIKYFVLRCPYCGRCGEMIQWAKDGTLHCIRCEKDLTGEK